MAQNLAGRAARGPLSRGSLTRAGAGAPANGVYSTPVTVSPIPLPSFVGSHSRFARPIGLRTDRPFTVGRGRTIGAWAYATCGRRESAGQHLGWIDAGAAPGRPATRKRGERPRDLHLADPGAMAAPCGTPVGSPRAPRAAPHRWGRPNSLPDSRPGGGRVRDHASPSAHGDPKRELTRRRLFAAPSQRGRKDAFLNHRRHIRRGVALATTAGLVAALRSARSAAAACGNSLQARVDSLPTRRALDLTRCSDAAGATVSR
jgi:hypothetical protein